MSRSLNADFEWQRCPDVARIVAKRVDGIVSEVRFALRLKQRMKTKPEQGS